MNSELVLSARLCVNLSALYHPHLIFHFLAGWFDVAGLKLIEPSTQK
jgi:hypothetical protein